MRKSARAVRRPRQSVVGLFVVPEFAWELLLGIYAAIWGFRRGAPIMAMRER